MHHRHIDTESGWCWLAQGLLFLFRPVLSQLIVCMAITTFDWLDFLDSDSEGLFVSLLENFWHQCQITC